MIVTKDGARYPTPEPGDPISVKAIKVNPPPYLMKDSIDVENLKPGMVDKEIKILTPEKHLIGEKHKSSSFTLAAAAWGWGAQIMAEALSTSETMPDVGSRKIMAQHDNIFPLEDTVAKNSTMMARSVERTETFRRLIDAAEESLKADPGENQINVWLEKFLEIAKDYRKVKSPTIEAHS